MKDDCTQYLKKIEIETIDSIKIDDNECTIVIITITDFRLDWKLPHTAYQFNDNKYTFRDSVRSKKEYLVGWTVPMNESF